MRLRSADDDVMTNMTSRGQQVPGGGTADVQNDVSSEVLTIVNATRHDAGLLVCYYVTSTRQSTFHVFRLVVTDDEPLVEGMYTVRCFYYIGLLENNYATKSPLLQ